MKERKESIERYNIKQKNTKIKLIYRSKTEVQPAKTRCVNKDLHKIDKN